MSKKSDHYLIVGAGIMGLSTAWALVRQGVRNITLIEQSTIPNPLGASGDEHRIIRRAYGPHSAYGFVISDAFKAWEMLWQDLGENHLDMRGFAILSREAGDEGAGYIEGLEKHGFAFQNLSLTETEKRFPFVRLDGLLRAAYSEEGGVLYSHKIALGLKALLENAGVELIENTQITKIEASKGIVVAEGERRFQADHIIVTAGAWAQRSLPDHTQYLKPLQTYVLYLKAPKQYQTAWQEAPPFLDVGNHVDGYVLPPGNGCELKFGSGLTRIPFNQQKLEEALSSDEEDFLRNAFGKAFLNIENYQILRGRRCAYTFTPDERFWAKKDHRLTIVSACSGHGYKFGSLIGLKLADSILRDDFDGFSSWLSGKSQ